MGNGYDCRFTHAPHPTQHGQPLRGAILDPLVHTIKVHRHQLRPHGRLALVMYAKYDKTSNVCDIRQDMYHAFILDLDLLYALVMYAKPDKQHHVHTTSARAINDCACLFAQMLISQPFQQALVAQCGAKHRASVHKEAKPSSSLLELMTT